MNSIDQINQYEQAGLEFEGEVVEGLPLLHMTLRTVDEEGRPVVAKTVMGVTNARTTFETALGIVEKLEEMAS